MKTPIMLVAILLSVGCARFSTQQTDISYAEGKPTRQITTKATSKTFFESKSSLTSFKATQTDKSQSATVGSLNQESTATNLVSQLQMLLEILKALPTK